MENSDFAIIGAGLAGCECALVLANTGLRVTIFEQKPLLRSEAHESPDFAELVCSNSLRSNSPESAVGALKEEMRRLGSPFMQAADACAIPADKALAVDRKKFSRALSARVKNHSNIRVTCRRVESLHDEALTNAGRRGIIVAGGPLMGGGIPKELAAVGGGGNCYFYDAIAPIVWTNSLNMDIVFRASRYAEEKAARGLGDYLNCPMNREEYEAFYAALLSGETFKPRDFEKETHFEGCMPIEALAKRGSRALSFGPMKPVGFTDPRTGRRPWAVLQLRAENANAETCNLVGCQTKLLQGEQKRIFRLVPGLENVEFARFGSMHRNTYINAPKMLSADLSLKAMSHVYLAGQITGVEGYVESAASALWLGLSLSSATRGNKLPLPPPESALGALLMHLQRPTANFQPSNVMFGLMPELGEKAGKKERKALYAARAKEFFGKWMLENSLAYAEQDTGASC